MKHCRNRWLFEAAFPLRHKGCRLQTEKPCAPTVAVMAGCKGAGQSRRPAAVPASWNRRGTTSSYRVARCPERAPSADAAPTRERACPTKLGFRTAPSATSSGSAGRKPRFGPVAFRWASSSKAAEGARSRPIAGTVLAPPHAGAVGRRVGEATAWDLPAGITAGDATGYLRRLLAVAGSRLARTLDRGHRPGNLPIPAAVVERT